MKITGTDSQGNSTTWPLGLERGRDRLLTSLAPQVDEPISIYYFEGGWNHGYPTFHVIIEYGDMEQTDYKFLSLDEMVKLFGVSPEEIMTNSSVVITKEDFFNAPNDQDLGKAARKAFVNEKTSI